MTTTIDSHCPTCWAEPGDPCQTAAGKPARRLHTRRIAQAAGDPDRQADVAPVPVPAVEPTRIAYTIHYRCGCQGEGECPDTPFETLTVKTADDGSRYKNAYRRCDACIDAAKHPIDCGCPDCATANAPADRMSDIPEHMVAAVYGAHDPLPRETHPACDGQDDCECPACMGEPLPASPAPAVDDAAAVIDIAVRGNAIVREQQRSSASRRKADEAAAFTLHGFRAYPRDLAQGLWQVEADAYAQRLWKAATGDMWENCDYGPGISAEQLRSQIEDVAAASPAVTVPSGDGTVVIASPRTGEIYRQLSAVEVLEENRLEAATQAKWEEAALAKARRETAIAEGQAKRRENARIAELEQEKLRAETAALRESNEVRWAKQKREFQAADRRRLRALHQTQDAEGIQRTNLDGLLLCDSCQRRYHEPGFDFCYSCKRGSGRDDHRTRMASGEVAARQSARQRVRDAFIAPEREAAQQQRQAVNGELNALLEQCGLPMWSGEGFQKYAQGARDRARFRQPLREADIPAVQRLLTDAEALSPAAHAKIASHLDMIRRALEITPRPEAVSAA